MKCIGTWNKTGYALVGPFSHTWAHGGGVNLSPFIRWWGDGGVNMILNYNLDTPQGSD